jgi:hypothetical protein
VGDNVAGDERGSYRRGHWPYHDKNHDYGDVLAYAFTGVVRVNGREHTICREVGTQASFYEPEPLAYDHTIRWTEGGSFTATRRERPWLLIEDGGATCLLTGVYDGVNTWNQPVPIAPSWPVNPAENP